MWKAYLQAFPYDDGFAELMSLMANIHRNEKKKQTPFTRSDFLPGHQVSSDEEDAGESLFNRIRATQQHG